MLATGLPEPNLDVLSQGRELLESYSELEPQAAHPANQSVCILGNGRSAIETAAHLLPRARSIRIIARRPGQWPVGPAAEAQAVARLAGSPKLLVDQLPSSPALTQLPDGRLVLARSTEVLAPAVNWSSQHADQPYIGPMVGLPADQLRRVQLVGTSCDRMIACTGWRADTSVFGPSVHPIWRARPAKFPVLSPAWEWAGLPHVYAAGMLAHGPPTGPRTDAGAFSRFRWHTRALFNYLEMVYEQEPWPSAALPRLSPLLVADTIVRQIRRPELLQTARELAELPYGQNGTAGPGLVDLLILAPDMSAAVLYPGVPDGYAHTVAGSRPFLGVGFGHRSQKPAAVGSPMAASVHFYRQNQLVEAHWIAGDPSREYKSPSRFVLPLVKWLRKVLKATEK